MNAYQVTTFAGGSARPFTDCKSASGVQRFSKHHFKRKSLIHPEPYIRPYLQTGQTALSIAQKLGYISVVETLKVVTDTVVTTTTTTTVEEKYKVLAPESMQETFMSDSEDEGGENI